MLRVFQIRRVRKPVLGWVFVLLTAVVMSFAAPNVGQAVAGRAPGLSFASSVGGVTQDVGITAGRLLEGAQSDLPDDVRVWFATKAPALGQSLREYLPDSAKVPPEAQIEVGNPTQVLTWSARLLRGTYAPENAVTPIEMWVAPVSIDARELGVVVYTEDKRNLYPLSLIHI